METSVLRICEFFRFFEDRFCGGDRTRVMSDQPVYESEIEQLIERARAGDRAAAEQLLLQHRSRVAKMVSVHIDPKVSARLDPSDVVQEALAEAAEKLPAYLTNPPVAFYPWLRKIAWRRLVEAHRRHLHADRRSVFREAHPSPDVSDASAEQLAKQLIGKQPSPSGQPICREVRRRMRCALEKLSPGDRELLLMRHVEDLRVAEIADVLKIKQQAVKSRLRRALERLHRSLGVRSTEYRMVSHTRCDDERYRSPYNP